ncbi:hypothetical protein [Actinomadura rugatobispora]|uniref:Uncharacterized protein n=1 Tax=Actinomadura rugatobispora TaxID=1994 RepID=A0ABW1ADP7_9ACTN|nr:hypothetical protein GCM10010200_021510 [Actinomadura rugatobispora]
MTTSPGENYESGSGRSHAARVSDSGRPDEQGQVRSGAEGGLEDGPERGSTPRSALAHEITEILLAQAPELPGEQVVRVRQSLLDLARAHGWSGA